MVNHLCYGVNSNTLSLLIDLAMKNKYLEYLNEIFDNKYKLIFNKYFEDFKLSDGMKSVSIINGSLFIINNLGQFLNCIRTKGYEITVRPKKFCPQVNSRDNYLFCLDSDFRESLYNHNLYHVDIGTIPES